MRRAAGPTRGRGSSDNQEKPSASAARDRTVLAGLSASAAQAADVNVNPFVCQTFQGGPCDGSGRFDDHDPRRRRRADTRDSAVVPERADDDDLDQRDDRRGQRRLAEARAAGGSHLGDLHHLPTGITLGAGDSLTVVFVTTLDHGVREVFNPAAGGPPGQPAFNGSSVTNTCTVTAVQRV
jgi:hypothetical protein